MRRHAYTSAAAAQIDRFVISRRAADGLCDSSEEYLHLFDAFCAREFPGAEGLTQEMVDRWREPRPTECANSCVSRCQPVVELVRFLREWGETDVVPPELPRLQETGYVPHAFTDDELADFFRLCDSYEATARLQSLQQDLIAKRTKKCKTDINGALTALRNHKCKAFDQALVPYEPAAENSATYRAFKVEVPKTIP